LAVYKNISVLGHLFEIYEVRVFQIVGIEVLDHIIDDLYYMYDYYIKSGTTILSTTLSYAVPEGGLAFKVGMDIGDEFT
jgi:hypothetical protein